MNATKAKFKKASGHRATRLGERIHSDVKEVPAASHGGHHFAVCFVDCYSRRGKVYCMRKKSEVIDKFIQFVEECKVDGVTVQCLRSDSGGEYTSDELQAYCRYNAIAQEWSAPHCQSANGTSEVFWRETFKLVRSILWDQQRSNAYWASALHFANIIRNHLVTSAVPDHPPEAVWKRAEVDTSHFRVQHRRKRSTCTQPLRPR